MEQKCEEIVIIRADLEQKSLELYEKEKEVESRIDQLGAAGGQMGKLKAELAEAKDSIENKELETEKLKAKLVDKQTELDKVVDKATLLGVTIDTLTEKIQSHEQELTEKASTSDLKKKEFLSKILELESKVTESEDSNTELREQLSILKEDQVKFESKHQEECRTLNDNLTAYAEELREVKKQEMELIQEKEKLQAEI